MGEQDCIWRQLLDVDCFHKDIDLRILCDAMTVILCAWLWGAIMLSKLRKNLSYRFLVNYIVAVAMRRAFPYIFDYISKLINFKIMNCENAACLDTFMAAFEIETLTHICVERYSVAKSHLKGRPVSEWIYSVFVILSTLFALTYTYAPNLGIGRFGKDFNCVDCTYDMILPTNIWDKILVLTVFFFITIKPILFMIFMLIRARLIENKIVNDYQKQREVTNSVIAMVSCYIISSAPVYTMRASVIIIQLIYGSLDVPFTIQEFTLAQDLQMFASSSTLLALLLFLPHGGLPCHAIFASGYKGSKPVTPPTLDLAQVSDKRD